ncbi:MAG: putative baseplate assembly protein [Chloroflexota bacterium]
MGFETPKLDDRSFEDLVAEARERIPLYSPEWTDYNLSDPGITMIELFAWMMDITLYRLNRVPDKHYIKFMELIGMRIHEAEAAVVPITFWLSAPQPGMITIPEGTQIATTRTEFEPAIIFSTDVAAEIRVAQLTQIMTGRQDTGRMAHFQTQSLSRLAAGFESQFPVFESSPPQPDDAVYLGLDADLSYHILGVELEVFTAEGAGIDPTNPPYVWEVLSADTNEDWVRAEIDEDTTLGLNVTGVIKMHLPPMRRDVRNEVSAYWVRCRLAPGEDARSYNVSPQIQKLTVQSWGITTNATHVTLSRNEILGRSDGTPGQQFVLAHTPIVPRLPGEYLEVHTVERQTERWVEVSDFASSLPDDRHYTLDSTTGQLRLGAAMPQRDGHVQIYGALPPKEALIIMHAYRSGGGRQGNVAIRSINVLKSALPYIERVSNRKAAQGGLDAESLESCKLRVPGYLRTLRRGVTASDFEYLSQEAAPGSVGRVKCLQPPDTNLGEIKVLIIPRIQNLLGHIAPESLHLLDSLRERIHTYLDERRLLSTRLEVMEPAYQWVQTEVRFHASLYSDPEAVRRAVEARLFSFLNPLTGGGEGTGWPFGRSLVISDVMAALLTVPGVDFVRSVKLYPVSHQNGQFVVGAESGEIKLVTHGVIVSYAHSVQTE